MPPDLRIHGFISRKSLLIMDNSLVLLEHSEFNDRVKKIMHESIESIIVWKKTPWIKMTLTALILGGVASIPFIAGSGIDNPGTKANLLIVSVILVTLEVIFLLRKNVFIRINHAGEALDLSFSAYPWQVRKFVEKSKTSVERVQRELREKRNAASSGENSTEVEKDAFFVEEETTKDSAS